LPRSYSLSDDLDLCGFLKSFRGFKPLSKGIKFRQLNRHGILIRTSIEIITLRSQRIYSSWMLEEKIHHQRAQKRRGAKAEQ